jgi:hypothetical protein
MPVLCTPPETRPGRRARDDNQTPSQEIPITLNQATQSPSTVSAPTPALRQALDRHHQRLMKSRG